MRAKGSLQPHRGTQFSGPNQASGRSEKPLTPRDEAQRSTVIVSCMRLSPLEGHIHDRKKAIKDKLVMTVGDFSSGAFNM